MPPPALPTLDALQELLASGEVSERAYVDGALRMYWARAESEQRGPITRLHEAVKLEARRAHASLRAEIAVGRARGAALEQRFMAVPPREREHYVEEVLGLAYPPLDEPALERELIGYQPSGFDELSFAFEAVQLSAGQRFLDLGSGLGKAVLLADLLRGARAHGIEQDARLCAGAERAAADLGCRATFLHADIRQVELDEADVVFMYLPFTGQVLRGVLERLLRPAGAAARKPPRFLCSAALDESAYPELQPVGPARSWLHVYAWR
jgi:protein-L-isoaspartate O-methyltransferase